MKVSDVQAKECFVRDPGFPKTKQQLFSWEVQPSPVPKAMNDVSEQCFSESMVANTCDSSAGEAEAEGLPRVQVQLG